MKPTERGIEQIGDILGRGFTFGERHNRIRNGEREPIPNHTQIRKRP